MLGRKSAVALCVLAGLFLVPFITHRRTHLVLARENLARFLLTSSGPSLRSAELNLTFFACLDRDADGQGEFGTLADLIGSARASEGFERPLSRYIREFRPDLGEGQISKWYLVKVFVPGDPDAAEDSWCAVAWPARYGRGGARRSLLYSWSYAQRDQNFFGHCDLPRFSRWGGGPGLGHIFAGPPFKSEIRRDIWSPWP